MINTNEIKKLATKLGEGITMGTGEAVVIAGLLIADALDRQTEINRLALEVQMKMAGSATGMMNKLSKSMDEMNEGDDWKKPRDLGDGDDEER